MATRKKKPVSKDDLRRLMKETKASVKSKEKKIDHPLAKYNSLDQLVCVLCNCVIKSEILWTPHIQSRQHKEKYNATKSQPQAGVKRKSTDLHDLVKAKKTKENGTSSKSSGIPKDFYDTPPPKKPKSILKNSTAALAAYSSSSSSSEDEDEAPSSNMPSSSTSAMLSSHPANPSLPADFFDSGMSTSDNKEDADTKPAVMADVLPEGFFDDPKMDAKVSEAIMEEDDEQFNVDRNIDEIDDQMQRWKEINDLEIKKEKIAQNKSVKQDDKEADSSDELDEADLEDFMDWRSKKSWK
ncbi:hypothetical protein KUTeg_014002 [Tegillarca granosa]|uniref:Zinc finger protein 830 n=1 Tax=Tegillarca granosa TaxID=220873 RepID=A0ABQ9EVC4_TEGGR|nr:hypothetical protein KUTeg_014002 [Tegillarca granosa]